MESIGLVQVACKNATAVGFHRV